jgi:putative isomerase
MIKKLLLLLTFPLLISSCIRDKSADTGKIDNNEKLQEYLLSGWNTWDNSNLLNFVYMPEGLSLRLTFRSSEKSYYPHFLDQTSISGPLQNFPGKITPLAHSYDGRYIDMILTWQGLKARIQVAREKRDIMILYTPIEVPQYAPLMILETGILYNKPGRVEKNNSIIQADVSQKTFNVQTSATELDVPLALSGPYLCVNSNAETAFFTGYGRSLEKTKSYFETRRKIYEEKQAKYGDLHEAYNAMRNLLGWNIIYDAFNKRSITPVSRMWSENWGGYILFDWDTYFTSAMFALDDKYNAYSNAIAITKSITPGGFIPNYTAAMENKSSFDRSQPPVGSMVCKLIYEKYQDKWFLSEVYENLLTWNRWWDKSRNNNGFLSWGSDPLEKGTDNNNKQAAMYESGLDNSPLFDEAVFNQKTHLLELASVDLMSLYIADCKALAFISGELGHDNDKAELLDRAAKYSLKLTELWDEKSGIYRDKNLVTNEFSKHLAPCNFYPLLSGVPSQQQAERMINEHLMNPKEFFGDFMLPSIARNDPAFPDNEYWRGRIWAPMNFLVYLGLRNYNLPEARKMLAQKSLDLLLKEWIENQRVYENYNSVKGVGGDVTSSDSFYSWGGLLALIPLMEGGYW